MIRLAAMVMATLALCASPAIAQPAAPDDEALAAWQDGKAAYDAGRFAEAAKKMLRADELRPGDEVLRFALQAAEQANDPVIGMTVVQRAESRQLHADYSDKLRSKFIGSVGQLMVRCPAGNSCTAQADRKPVEPEKPMWILSGDHVVEVTPAGGASVLYAVRVRAGEIEIVPEPRAPSPAPAPVGPTGQPPPPPPPPPVTTPDDSGPSPAWFWVTLSATAVLTGVTIWSGVDTIDKHDAFEADKNSDTQQDGQDAQLRTNVLIGATGALALTSAILGFWVVDWNGDEEPAKMSVRAAVTPDSAWAAASIAF